MISRPKLTIGIEEEYQIIDPETGQLRSFITQFLEEGKLVMVEREIKAELHQSMVELGTPVCTTVAEAKEELLGQRAFISRLAAEKGLAIVAAGTHPMSHWSEQEVTPFPRYQGLLDEMQLVAQRMLIFGMHIHVGIDDPDFAIDTMNVVRYMLPSLLALSTSSPFWTGRRTGLKSYRAVIFENLPRTGIPDAFPNRAAYQGLVQTLINTHCIPDSSKIWWDIRPHHSYPTLEFRICDMCPRVDEAIAIAALCQAILLWHWRLRQRNVTFRVYSKELIDENKWRAARYGLDDKMIDFGKRAELPARSLIQELLELVGEEIAELGIQKEIEPIYQILATGTSADRQLQAYHAHGEDVKAVVDHLMAETVEGL